MNVPDRLRKMQSCCRGRRCHHSASTRSMFRSDLDAPNIIPYCHSSVSGLLAMIVIGRIIFWKIRNHILILIYITPLLPKTIGANYYRLDILPSYLILNSLFLQIANCFEKARRTQLSTSPQS